MAKKAAEPDLVDLHLHSTASDGVYSPREVVRQAGEAGLRAIALTDHDTVAGVPEALTAGGEFGVEVVPAVEISAEFDDGACHILGYFVDEGEANLTAALVAARASRDTRNRKILDRLRDLGISLTMAEVAAQMGGGVVTRAHFAAAMLAKGVAASWDEAFDRYLGRGKPAYVYRERVAPEEAIRLIHGALGLAALAHPRQLNRDLHETEVWIERLARDGLDAVETQSPDHTPKLGEKYRAVARRLGLCETGGSDWHGRADSTIRLGAGDGSLRVGYEVVEAMKVRLAERSG